jgi:hypothetical protein
MLKSIGVGAIDSYSVNVLFPKCWSKSVKMQCPEIQEYATNPDFEKIIISYTLHSKLRPSYAGMHKKPRLREH